MSLSQSFLGRTTSQVLCVMGGGWVFGVFVYFDVGYSVISLKFGGIPVLENSAMNGFFVLQGFIFGIARKTLKF